MAIKILLLYAIKEWTTDEITSSVTWEYIFFKG